MTTEVPSKKILIIGSINDNHLIRLVKHIKLYDCHNQLKIDGFNFTGECVNRNQYIDSYYFVTRHFFTFFYRLKYVNSICKYIDIVLSFKNIKDQYQIYNFHYPTIYTSFLSKFISHDSKIIVTPWGSDVYRIHPNEVKAIQKLYDVANYISVPPLKFKLDIQNKFNVPESKFINLRFGSEVIDELIQTNTRKGDAKTILGYPQKYIITCGYNGNPNQNHIHIIKALVSIKELLPKELILLFPITYGAHDNIYIKELKSELSNSGFEYVTYESYLNNETIANIRIATDLFIHIQSTDAYSATVQEFLLTDTIVFNGNWLRYPTLEIDGIPYHLVNSVNELADSLSTYFKQNNQIIISDICKDLIKKRSWIECGKDWFNYFENE